MCLADTILMNGPTLYTVALTLFLVAKIWSVKHFQCYLMSDWYVIHLQQCQTPNTLQKPPTRCLCFCNWVDFSSLSDRSTYQYNYSNVNHVERKRQRVHLFAFLFKGILYSVLFMVFVYYKVKFVVHHYHVIGLSLVCFSIVCSPAAEVKSIW